jgi:hypothetical protein
MPRAIVLPALARAAALETELESPTYGSASEQSAEAAMGDKYTERLVKYIPGEALVVFLPLSSVRGIADGQLVGLSAGAVICAVLWAINRNAKLIAAVQQPAWLVATYTAVAFTAWAIGTSRGVQELLGAPALTCTIVMALSAALLPALDEMIGRTYIVGSRG